MTSELGSRIDSRAGGEYFKPKPSSRVRAILGSNLRRCQLILRLRLLRTAEKKPYYSAQVHVAGLVRVVDQWPESEVLELVEANGPALLYGAAREMLRNLTARGPWPVLCLHSVTFVQPQAPPKARPTADSAAVQT